MARSFRFSASAIQLNKLVPLICKLVSDSNGTVKIDRFAGRVLMDVSSRFVNKPSIHWWKSIDTSEKKSAAISPNEVYPKQSEERSSSSPSHVLVLTCLFRLKQLYEKFDDVVASGRMIAKVSDIVDTGASLTLINSK